MWFQKWIKPKVIVLDDFSKFSDRQLDDAARVLMNHDNWKFMEEKIRREKQRLMEFLSSTGDENIKKTQGRIQTLNWLLQLSVANRYNP
jgi:hypothetical protein